MHWNYELEIYPQPMHRQLAFAAIDEGASAIIGCHSHCVQGIEFYKDAPIVYGLGNWYFPHGFYFDGKLKFPDFSNDQLAFEWNPSGNKSFCHLFKYKPETHDINFIEKQPWEECTLTNELTPFRSMSHQEYISWFKKNRRKRKLLPIYKNMNQHFVNVIKDRVVSARQKGIKALVKLKLKGSPS